MSDEQILDEKDYEIAILKKEVDNKEVDNIDVATDIVGEIETATGMTEETKKIKANIDKIAFEKKK